MEVLPHRLDSKLAGASGNNPACWLIDFRAAKAWLERAPLVRAKNNSALAAPTGQCQSFNFTFSLNIPDARYSVKYQMTNK